MTSYVDNVNNTLTAPIPYLSIDSDEDREALKMIYRDRDYFKTLEFVHEDISAWVRDAASVLMSELGIGEDLSEHAIE